MEGHGNPGTSEADNAQRHYMEDDNISGFDYGDVNNSGSSDFGGMEGISTSVIVEMENNSERKE